MKRHDLFILAFLLIFTITAIIVFSSATARARTINVDDDGGKDYVKIQDAINVSSPGDTIYVYNGTYNESITVNKTINLVGESNQSTIIKGTGAIDSKGIYIAANNVNISNIKIDVFWCGIYIGPFPLTSNNNIISSTITNCAMFGIYLRGSSNNAIIANTIANTSIYGIYLDDSSNNIITSNTITNCTTYGIYLYQDNSNNIIIANNIYDNRRHGLYLHSGTGNTAINNWWGDVTGPYHPSFNPSGKGDNISDDIEFIPWLKHPFDKLVVNNNTEVYYATIQDAVNAASDGDTIYVYNGTYNEQVTISKRINLTGESNQSTIIRGWGSYDSRGINVIMNTNNMCIRDIKIDNFYYGIFLWHNSNNIIASNTVTNSEYGIYLSSSSNNNIITSNTISNCSDVGVCIINDSNNNTIASNRLINSSMTILDDNVVINNTINGKLLLYYKNINTTSSPQVLDGIDINGIILYNCSGFEIKNIKIECGGILLVRSSRIEITSNTLSNCSQCGIYLYYSSNNTITFNIISNSSHCIRLYNSSTNTVTSNTVSGSIYEGISLCSSSNNNSSNNTITRSTITNCHNGIFVDSSNNIITSNTISNCDFGIYLLGGSNNTITGGTVTNCSNDGIFLWYSSNNNITANDIYENKHYGLYGSGGSGNTAYNNWWGNASGPHNTASNPSGTGDNITDGIPFIPWATEPFNITQPPITSQNHAPIISSITPQNMTVNTTFTLQINATDIDGDNLTYNTSMGAINSTGYFTITPTVVGEYNITITVNDSKTQNSTTFVLIAIAPPANQTTNQTNNQTPTNNTNINQTNIKYVGGTGINNYTTIQSAINASSPGGTIYVYNGTYIGPITINKPLNLIGESSHGAIILGEGFGEGIRIIADNTSVSNLRIDNFSYGIHVKGQNNTIAHNVVALADQYGIILESTSNNTLEDNAITDSGQGIRLEYSTYNTVNANSVANCSFGIVVYYSTQNIITSNTAVNTAIIITGDNTVSNNTINGKPLLYFKNTNAAATQILDNASANGIMLYNCSGFKITNMTIDYGGIILEDSSGIEISMNTITNSAAGIYMSYGVDNLIVSNTIITDNGIGIDLDPGLNNTISRNNITNCSYGIYLHFSSDNNITANNIYGNSEYGLYSEYSTNNTAIKNWWGDVSGPYHQTKNPLGKGDNISGDILFSPWLAAQFNGTMPETNQTNTNQTQNETTPITTEKKESKGFIPGFEIYMLANIVCLWILLTRKRRKIT